MKCSIHSKIVIISGKWVIEEPKRGVEQGNLGLVLKSKARHAAISKLLDKPFKFEDKPLVVQYEVIFQEGQECGGAYLKLLSVDPRHTDLKNFHDKTPYSIMFGPDKCGNDHKVNIKTRIFSSINHIRTMIIIIFFLLFIASFYLQTQKPSKWFY